MTQYAALSTCYININANGGQSAHIPAETGEVRLGDVDRDAATARPALENWRPRIESAGYTVVGDVRVTSTHGSMAVRVGKLVA